MAIDIDALAKVPLERALLACGLVDTHYHVGPELIPRRYNLIALADRVRKVDATLVLKNHTYTTAPLAALARAELGVNLLGSVVLNRFVGGMNADAVVGALSGNHANVLEPQAAGDRPLTVWMPTVHAESHLRVLGHGFDPRWCGCCGPPPASGRSGRAERPVRCFDESLRPVSGLLEVLEVIARNGCILATGHLSAAEVERLVPLALDCGVRRVVITHPHYPATQLDDRQLRELTRDSRVYVEHCFAIHSIEQVPMERIAEAIKATGPEQVVIASDFGQICSPPFPNGTVLYAEVLEAVLARVFNRRDLLRMFSDNGRAVIDLEGACSSS